MKTLKTLRTLIIATTSALMVGCTTMGTPFGTGVGTSNQTTDVLSGVLGAITNGEAITGVLSSVIGLDKMTQRQLIGTWVYEGPGCAFTSQSALARAGGEIAATQVEEKLADQYAKLGLNAKNTIVQFNQDGTYAAVIGGRKMSGKYTYDEKNCAVKMSGLLLSLNGYVKRNSLGGMSLLFESKKILPVLQAIASMSGNTSLETIGEISKNYDGVRIGFDMKK